MSYIDNLGRDDLARFVIGVVKPRIKVTGFSLVSGSVYEATFAVGEYVNAVKVGTTNYSAGDFDSLGANEFAYRDGFLRVGSNPGSNQVVATFSVHFSTTPIIYFADPEDNTTPEIQYEPLLVRAPNDVQNTVDALFGAVSSFATEIQLNNTEGTYDILADDVVFSNAEMTIWDVAGPISTANIKRRFDGFINSFSWQPSAFTLRGQDRFSLLDQTVDPVTIFKNTTIGYVQSSTAGVTELRSEDELRPIRKVWGRAKAVECVLIDDVGQKWLLPDCDVGDVNFTITNQSLISGGGDPSEWRFTCSTSNLAAIGNRPIVQTVAIGDSISNPSAGDGSEENPIGTVTAVNVGANTIDVRFNTQNTGLNFVNGGNYWHRITPHLINTGNNFSRNSKYAGYREYTTSIFTSGGTSYCLLTFDNDATAVHDWDYDPDDRLFCDFVVDADNTQSDRVGGIYGGATSVLYDIMSGLEPADRLGDFDASNLGITDYEQSIVVPREYGALMPSYRELINSITESTLIKLIFGDNRKWSLDQAAPLGAVEATADIDDEVRDSIIINYDYRDLLTLARVQYDGRSAAFRRFNGLIGADDEWTIYSSVIYDLTQTENTELETLFGIKRQRTIKSTLRSAADASEIASHYLFALGDRRGVVNVTLTKDFLGLSMGEILQLLRERVPGTDKFNIIGYEKLKDRIVLTLDEQKGIEDNSGSW